MFLEKLERFAKGSGMGLESALRELCERRRIPVGQVARDLKSPKREVFFWADAFGISIEDLPPKAIASARRRKVSLRDYFLKNFGQGVGWMAEDLGVAFTTVEEYYAVFSGGEAWRMEHDGRRGRKA